MADPTELIVEVNRDEPNQIAVSPVTFEPAGSFDLVFINYGQPAHVHVRLDEALTSVLSIPDTNFFVEGENARVTVDVGQTVDDVTGTLTVATGYGASEATATITVHDGVADPVAVDERLAKPAPPEPPSFLERVGIVDLDVLSVAAIVAVLLVAAVATGIVIDSALAGVIAFLVLLLAAIGVAYYL